MKRSSFLKSLIGIPFVKVAVDNLEKPKAELVSTNYHTEMTGTACYCYPSITPSGSVKKHYTSPTPSISASPTPTPSMTRTISISKTTKPHPSVKPK